MRRNDPLRAVRLITDAEEIASIERCTHRDLNGWKHAEQYYAYAQDLARWRERQRILAAANTTSQGSNHKEI